MKAKQITYCRLINDSNRYEHEKIEITLEIEDGEKAVDVLVKAREFVEKNNKYSKEKDERKRLEDIVANKDRYTFTQVQEAINILAEMDIPEDDLPF